MGRESDRNCHTVGTDVANGEGYFTLWKMWGILMLAQLLLSIVCPERVLLSF